MTEMRWGETRVFIFQNKTPQFKWTPICKIKFLEKNVPFSPPVYLWNMKYIITEHQNTSLRRRFSYIKKLLDVVLDNMYPCDYSNESHFYIGVIYELETFLDLEGIKRVQPEEVIDFVKQNLKDYIIQYYINSQEDC